jgi:hypothetical protein
MRAWLGFVAAILSLFLLTGCVTGAADALACRNEAGPEPYVSAGIFGIAGAAWAAQQPEHQVWQARVHQCFVERQAARQGAGKADTTAQ